MIKPKTLNFLKRLIENNNRDWFNEHKPEYLEARENFEEFVGELLSAMSVDDPAFSVLNAGDCVFRIYRDVRFSKNKLPYKNHLAAGISKGGKRVHVPGYHLHLMPGDQSFFAGGLWHPDREMLAKVRQEIDYNPVEFKRIITQIEDKKIYDPFVDEEQLSRPPKGYHLDNPMVEYLKMKNFLQSRSFTDKQVFGTDFLKDLMDSYLEMKGFVQFIERALD